MQKNVIRILLIILLVILGISSYSNAVPAPDKIEIIDIDRYYDIVVHIEIYHIIIMIIILITSIILNLRHCNYKTRTMVITIGSGIIAIIGIVVVYINRDYVKRYEPFSSIRNGLILYCISIIILVINFIKIKSEEKNKNKSLKGDK